MTYQALVQQLTAMAAPWATRYGDSKVIATAVVFAHLGGMLVAGGFALAADRSTWRAWRAPQGERARHLAELRAVHRPVVAGLAVVFASGVLLFLADVKTYAVSLAFGLKLLLVGLLLVNGLVMTHAETALRASGAASGPGPEGTAWRRLHLAAATSVVLWLATTLVGVVLTNV